MQQPESFGRLMQWSIELSQYEISYRPRIAIKGQVVVDFILEFTNIDPPEPPPTVNTTPEEVDPHSWTLNVNGSSRKEGSGDGLILTTPEKEDLKFALRFQISASNNEVKYEALIAGLRLARDVGVDCIQVFNDSQLVVGQINGDFDAKEKTMKSYRDVALLLIRLFNSFHIKHIPCSENAQVDEMAQLSSTDQSDLSHGVKIDYLAHPATSPDSQEIYLLQNEHIPWEQAIIQFLEQGILPRDKNEVDKLRARSANYIIIEGILYKWGLLRPYLKCLNAT